MGRITFLIDVAKFAGIPIVVTGEDIPNVGDLDPRIQRALPEGTLVHNKMIFNLAAEPEIIGAIRTTNRRTAILVGIETDVCIAQSGLGLLDAGYRVIVPNDCTIAFPAENHPHGLERLRAAGALIYAAKEVYYELIRSVDRMQEFKTTRTKS